MESTDVSDGESASRIRSLDELTDRLFALCKGSTEDLDDVEEGSDPAAVEVGSLVDMGIAVGVKDSKEWTPIVWASFSGLTEVVHALLARGAEGEYRRSTAPDSLGDDESVDEDAASRETAVISPLHWASYKGHLPVVWLLVEAGFSPNEVDNCGNNSLHLACSTNHYDVVRALLGSGVIPGARNGFGNLALDLATDPRIRDVVSQALNSPRCAATGVGFSPTELLYMCDSCNLCFTEEASTATHVQAAAGSTVMKPARYCESCMYAIQEAETALEKAMVPLEMLPAEDEVSNGGGTPTLPPPQYPALGAAASPFMSDSPLGPSAGAGGATTGGLGLGLGLGLGGGPFDGVESQQQQDVMEGLFGGVMAPALGEGPELDPSQIDNLLAALETGKAVGCRPDLLKDANLAVNRFNAADKLRTSMAAIAEKRPTCSRADIDSLNTVLEEAGFAGVGSKLLADARRVADSCVAECRMHGLISVCENIKVATHAHDGDLLRLSQMTQRTEAGGRGDPATVAHAKALLARLSAEIRIGDVLEAGTTALKAVYDAMVAHATADPTLLPWLPGREPVAKKKKKKGDKKGSSPRKSPRAAAPPPKSARPTVGPRGRGVAKASSRRIVSARSNSVMRGTKEQLPPEREPTPQQAALRAFAKVVNTELLTALAAATVAGVPATVVDSARERQAEFIREHKRLAAEEARRIATFEEEKKKRDKKARIAAAKKRRAAAERKKAADFKRRMAPTVTPLTERAPSSQQRQLPAVRPTASART